MDSKLITDAHFITTVLFRRAAAVFQKGAVEIIFVGVADLLQNDIHGIICGHQQLLGIANALFL